MSSNAPDASITDAVLASPAAEPLCPSAPSAIPSTFATAASASTLPAAPPSDRAGTSAPFAGKPWLRRAVSVLLLYHVLAIIVAPASVRPSSRLMQAAFEVFRPYLQAFYLNHGFHFFAPEPSYSTLVGFTLEYPDGRVETGRFPNRGIQPRLMYHRHFMLTEFLGFVPDEEEGAWHRSYARHLGRTTGAEFVSLSRITHYLPTPQAVLEGTTLNDSASFTEVPLGRFECDEL